MNKTNWKKRIADLVLINILFYIVDSCANNFNFNPFKLPLITLGYWEGFTVCYFFFITLKTTKNGIKK